MGNAIVCQSQKGNSSKLSKLPLRNSKEHVDANGNEIKIVSVPVVPIPQKITPPILEIKQGNLNCLKHTSELIRAVCITPDCPTQQTSKNIESSRMLCCECLIEHQCATKLRSSDFISKLRNLLPKDTLEVFMEIFDDNNQVKVDAQKSLVQIQDQTSKKFHEYVDKTLPEIIINFYVQQSDLKATPIEYKTVLELRSLLDGKLSIVRNDTLDLAILLIIDPKMVERVCEQIETCRNKVVPFGQDFCKKFQSTLNSYLYSMKFLFGLFPTQMDYIADEETVKGVVVKKQDVKALAANNKMDKKSVNSSSGQVADKKPTKQDNDKDKSTLLAMCDVHKQEILAICITPGCLRGRRKLCTDCLIENADCPQRMKTADFVAKLNRIIGAEVLEQLLIPWEDQSILPSMKKEGVARWMRAHQVGSREYHPVGPQEHIHQVPPHRDLSIQGIPKRVHLTCSRGVYHLFIHQQQRKIYSNCKAVELGTRFLITTTLVQTFLDAIVKTEQVVPQKLDKLLHKLQNINVIFLDRIHALVEIFKINFDLIQINRFCNILNEEQFTLEESICKVNTQSNTLSEWTKHQSFSPVDGLSITDSCHISDGLLAFAQLDGHITLFNIMKQKLVGKLKHGSFVTSLVSIYLNGKPIIISSGYSEESGSSIAVWDLQQKAPFFLVPNAHKDSIRQIKMLQVNPTLSQVFGKNDMSTQSQVLSTPSHASSHIQTQSSIPLDQKLDQEQLLSCSDDGTVKLWRLDSDLKLTEDQSLCKMNSCVLDFTLLNGCIMITACIDHTISLSLPFITPLPFQKLQDDSPVYSISPIDITLKYNAQSRQQKSTTNIQQQKFITGNDKGVAKIYTWQNGKAVVQKVVNLHKDRINRIILQFIYTHQHNRIQTGFVASISNDQTIALTVVQQPKLLNQIIGHKSSITSVTYIKDLQSIVTADSSGQILVWK